MGMKEYEFLIQSRNQILNAEEKIIQIDEKLLSIEQEINKLSQEKGKLKLPKSENWKEDLDIEYQSQLRKFEEFKKSKLSELEELERRIIDGEKSWNFWIWSTILLFVGLATIFTIIEILEFIVGDFVDWDSPWIENLASISMTYFLISVTMLIINIGKSPSPRDHEDFSDNPIIRREDVSREIASLGYKHKESFLGDVNKKKRSFSRAENRDRRIDTILEGLGVEITELIQEKENLAEEIKITWKGVSHLIPQSD